MAKGPLAVRWGDWTLDEPQAGAVSVARVELENTGTVPWRDGDPARLPLARRPRQPDRLGRRAHAPAARRARRARRPSRRGCGRRSRPGRYRFALDLVAEYRAWFSELGSELASRRGRGAAARAAARTPSFPPWVEPAPDWDERVAAAHAEGYGVVAGTIEWGAASAGAGRTRSRRTRRGRAGCPGFSHPLVCPSVLDGIELERLPGRRRAAGVRGAGRRAVGLRRPDRPAGPARASAYSSIASRSSTRLKTNEPSTSATTAATAR